MLLNEIVDIGLDDDEGDTSPAAAAKARARLRTQAKLARADAMRHGAGIKQTSSQIKALGAIKSNKNNAHLASPQDEEISDAVVELARQAYTGVRVFKNYNLNTIAVKVGGVNISDKVSKPVRMLNAKLRAEYGIEPVELGSSTVIYHIPYAAV